MTWQKTCFNNTGKNQHWLVFFSFSMKVYRKIYFTVYITYSQQPFSTRIATADQSRQNTVYFVWALTTEVRAQAHVLDLGLISTWSPEHRQMKPGGPLRQAQPWASGTAGLSSTISRLARNGQRRLGPPAHYLGDLPCQTM